MTNWRIPLSRISFDDAELRSAMEVLRSGWITMGASVAQFEEAFASYLGVSGAVAVTSGTAALHLGCVALGVRGGREVIVPTLSFVATANAVLMAGGKPVFADSISENDLNLDPEDAVRRIGPNTAGIIAVHYGGNPCKLDLLRRICSDRALFLIEDAAHAPGGTYGRHKLGSLGDAGCFSFYGNKNLTTGEGGMVVSDDQRVLALCRSLRSHGMSSSGWERFSRSADNLEMKRAGFNYRPTELVGAIGLVQLGRLEEQNSRRRRLLKRYRDNLSGCDRLTMPFAEVDRETSAHLCVVTVKDRSMRPPLRSALSKKGIQTSIHYPPIHLQEAYLAMGARSGDCPVAEEVANRIVTLPLYPQLTESQVDLVCETVVGFLT